MSQEWIDLVQPGLAEDFFHVGEMPPFDGSEVSAKSFSPALALWMAEFSRLIYRREEKEFKANPPLVARSSLTDSSPAKERNGACGAFICPPTIPRPPCCTSSTAMCWSFAARWATWIC